MIMKGPQFAGYEPRDLRWAPDGQHLFFRWKQYSEPIEKDFDTYVVGRDGKGLRKLSDDEAKDAPPVRAFWSRDRKRAVSIDDGDVVLYENNRHRKLTNTIEAESGPRFTRDERHVAFVRNNNLFVVAIDDGSIAEVTNIAGPDDKEPLWDEKKGTDSQEFVKSEERKLFDVIERRAKKKEEDEAKKKKEHPLKPYKLEKKQIGRRPAPHARRQVRHRLDQQRRRQVEEDLRRELRQRERVHGRDQLAREGRRLRDGDEAGRAVDDRRRGEDVPERAGAGRRCRRRRRERTEKQETKSEAATAKKDRERDVTFGAVRFSDDGTKAFVALRARDNKDALDPGVRSGHGEGPRARHDARRRVGAPRTAVGLDARQREHLVRQRADGIRAAV